MFKISDKRIIDFFYTISGNLISLISGVITAFIIPKFLNIEQYGYLKIFTFYVSYVGIFHFGFNDGIYVNFGKLNYDELPKKKFRLFFRFLYTFQFIISILFLTYTLIFITDFSRKLIYVFISINIILLNLSTFFDFVNQFTKRFKLYSIILILSKVLYVISCIIIIVFKKNNYIPFMISQTIVNLNILIIYIITSRQLVFGEREKLNMNKKLIKNLFSIGIFVMIGNLMSQIIVGIDRMFIDRLFTIKEFAMYSFCISILTLFYTLTSAITTVVYPYLARTQFNKLKFLYRNMKVFVFLSIGFLLSGYFFLVPFINHFLPNYANSLKLLLILFPTVLYNCQIIIVSSNYYKVMKYQKEYTINNFFAFISSFIMIIISIYIYKNLGVIAISTLISFIIWMFYCDIFFARKFKDNYIKLHVVDILNTLIFLFCGLLLKWYVGFFVYIAMFCILVFIFFKKDIVDIKNKKLDYFSM